MVRDSVLTNLPVGHSDRIISMHLPLSVQQHATLVGVYASTLQIDPAEKDNFYTDICSLLRNIPTTGKIVLLGDVNARVGRNSETWKGVLGKEGVGNCNDNGRILLDLCAEQQLCITNVNWTRPNTARDTERHRIVEEWNSCRNWWHPTRD